MSRQELRTITIALALLNLEDMEREMKEQNLTRRDVTYDHLALFKDFTDETGLYPFPDVQKSEQGIKKVEKGEQDGKE